MRILWMVALVLAVVLVFGGCGKEQPKKEQTKKEQTKKEQTKKEQTKKEQHKKEQHKKEQTKSAQVESSVKTAAANAALLSTAQQKRAASELALTQAKSTYQAKMTEFSLTADTVSDNFTNAADKSQGVQDKIGRLLDNMSEDKLPRTLTKEYWKDLEKPMTKLKDAGVISAEVWTKFKTDGVLELTAGQAEALKLALKMDTDALMESGRVVARWKEGVLLEQSIAKQRELTAIRLKIANDEELKKVGAWEDTSSGLTWQVTPTGDRMLLSEAKAHCAGLSLDDGGWRLPTKVELASLIRGCKESNCGYKKGPAMSGCYWPDELEGECTWYWSSSSVEDESDKVWDVAFAAGRASVSSVDNIAKHVRCVR